MFTLMEFRATIAQILPEAQEELENPLILSLATTFFSDGIPISQLRTHLIPHWFLEVVFRTALSVMLCLINKKEAKRQLLLLLADKDNGHRLAYPDRTFPELMQALQKLPEIGISVAHIRPQATDNSAGLPRELIELIIDVLLNEAKALHSELEEEHPELPKRNWACIRNAALLYSDGSLSTKEASERSNAPEGLMEMIANSITKVRAVRANFIDDLSTTIPKELLLPAQAPSEEISQTGATSSTKASLEEESMIGENLEPQVATNKSDKPIRPTKKRLHFARNTGKKELVTEPFNEELEPVAEPTIEEPPAKVRNAASEVARKPAAEATERSISKRVEKNAPSKGQHPKERDDYSEFMEERGGHFHCTFGSCAKSFPHPSNCRGHIASTHLKLSFRCTKCGYQKPYKQNVYRHLDAHKVKQSKKKDFIEKIKPTAHEED